MCVVAEMVQLMSQFKTGSAPPAVASVTNMPKAQVRNLPIKRVAARPSRPNSLAPLAKASGHDAAWQEF